MGVSISSFMCGCKIYPRRKPSKSNNLLLSNGSVSISSHLPPGNHQSCKLHSNNLNITKCDPLDCCSLEKQDILIPWCQEMETHKDRQDNMMIASPSSNLEIGSMRITKPQFKALLVFPKKDDLCKAWQTALEKLGFEYDVEDDDESALEQFRRNQHHLVVIENQRKTIDSEKLCRNQVDEISLTRDLLHAGFDRLLNDTTNTEEIEDEILQLEAGPLTLQLKFRSCQAVFLALEKSRDLIQIADENFKIQAYAWWLKIEVAERQRSQYSCPPSNMSLIVFPRQPYVLDELQTCVWSGHSQPYSRLYYFEVSRVRLTKRWNKDRLSRATSCDSSAQYKPEERTMLYVNKMYERMTGFSSKQTMGTCLSSYFDNERNDEDTWEKIKDEIQSGKDYDGYAYTKRNLGEDVQFYVLILPLTRQDESIHQYVVLSRLSGNNSVVPDLSQLIGIKRKNSYEYHRKHSGTADQLQIRRLSNASLYLEGDGTHRRTNSLAKIHSMAIEAPITQIINLISIIRDSSQPSVSDVLDQILDILRNSELYSPADLPNRSRDPMLTDFVEGLVTGSGYSHRRASGGTSENLLGRTPPSGGIKPPPTPGSKLANVMNADPHIAECLKDLESWNYDVLALERVTAKKPLVHLGMHTLNQFDTCEVLSCTPTTLHSWLVEIEANYHLSNPYHNSTHAADVLHATAYFLRKERVKTWMEPLDEVAALLAAIIHDVDHPGKTNAFLVNSNNPLALLYNDTAVLESHHAAFAFKFTVNSGSCNIFKNMSKDNFRNIRQSIIDMVLATELSKHFEHVNKFISIVTKSNNNINSPLEQEGTASTSNRASGTITPVVTHELKTLIKRMMIKVADVINPARKTELCVEWARRISEEYFTQTDEEKRLGLPVVMPHFDRKTCSMPKSQMTFMDYFLMDMFEAWHEFCSMEDIMKNLYDNYHYWQKLQDKGIMRLAELEDTSFSDDEELEDLNIDNSVPSEQTERKEESSEVTLPLENHLS